MRGSLLLLHCLLLELSVTFVAQVNGRNNYGY